jgi:hypothetical protein
MRDGRPNSRAFAATCNFLAIYQPALSTTVTRIFWPAG